MMKPEKTHRRRKRQQKKQPPESMSPPRMSPITTPMPKIPNSIIRSSDKDDEKKKLLKGSVAVDKNPNRIDKRRSLQRTISQASAHKEPSVYCQGIWTCFEFTGMNFLIPALAIWTLILTFCWWPELKDNALDCYYLQYPEKQPLSPISGTILPLIPSVWVYDPNKNYDHLKLKSNKDNNRENGNGNAKRPLKEQVQKHLNEYQQPHYYMLPQDFYNQQPPTDNFENNTSSTDGSNTALEAPPIRGVLIVLHSCHQSGLHFFQLPESRIVAAHALQRGLAIFSPTASSAASLNSTKTKAMSSRQNLAGAQEKHCWSASLDGDELLGPLLYEWAREMEVMSLPRMAIGIASGANLIIDSNLYKRLRLQAISLYGLHHPVGFDAADLERDVVPATTFVVFPKNKMATQFALKHYKTLSELADEDEEETEKLRKEEERAVLEQEKEESGEEESNGSQSKDKKATKIKTFFRKTQLHSIHPHDWTPTLCQERLPEYHTRCRSFFRHIAKFQIKKQRKAEAREMKRDPHQRLKRLRIGSNVKQKYQLISSKGEVLQSSKSTFWNPVMESLGLDDWTTHIMAFTLASSGRTKTMNKKEVRQKRAQLMQFPTTATPEGRSWLWASMLQEIEVAYGMQELTSEHSVEILDFLMYHAGLSIRGGD